MVALMAAAMAAPVVLRATNKFTVYSDASEPTAALTCLSCKEHTAPVAGNCAGGCCLGNNTGECCVQHLPSACENGNGCHKGEKTAAVPRVKLTDLNWSGAAGFMELMLRHSFVIVEDDTGRVESAYLDLIAQLQRFFDAPLDSKLRCRGDIYFNERGVPMWQTGFEKCGEMRQAFRIHAGHTDRQPWPDAALRAAWLRLLRMCERICDRALSLALGYLVAPPENKPKHDFSVCYALCYPNDASKYSEELNVTEHVDPSLFVIEPCCGVAGLEVLDAQSREWVAVEAICRPGKDLVLFGGKALQEATDGAISGTLHRVRRGPRRRHCFIYEQKYDDFFPAPLD
eukprot:TRINITY_DN2267_c0_g3_i1.p1 TRINITY_DN2267_c0_g3~~TRINITY_DN2267_c0_g3_i1.p1  ORF type:complete len:343 (+),score=86.86 TRINITY_DN2267_c0_g3_i1:263-1291(+)